MPPRPATLVIVCGEAGDPLRGVQLQSRHMLGRGDRERLQGLLAGDELIHSRVLLLAGGAWVRLSFRSCPASAYMQSPPQ
jgi:hypothetical protein